MGQIDLEALCMALEKRAATRAILRELQQVLVELELVSNVSAVNLESSGGDAGEDIGGRRPPGGVDRADDRELEWPMKSVDHFRRRIARAHSDQALATILEDAKTALAAWRRQPAPGGEPEYGTPQWKRWVAESDLAASEIARKYGVSKRYINRIRALYCEAA